MDVDIFVQARMGSTRLPGKVLKPVLQRPLLHYQMERLQRVTKAKSCRILTTTNVKDQAIVDFCNERKIPFFRGSEEDVLARFYQAATTWGSSVIVRITGDCPLIDPVVVDQAIDDYIQESKKQSQPLYVSNVIKRTFPRGLDVEVFSVEALEQAYLEAKEASDREHVTRYMLQHPEQFHLKNFTSPVDLSRHRWTVDTEEDFELVKRIIEDLYPKNPRFTTQDILELLKRHPEWEKINAEVKQKKD